jgi:hypothetical protein
MYGIPPDLPLERLVGNTIDGIWIGKYQITFSLGGTNSIAVQGGWELRDSAGQHIDSGQDHAERDCYRVHRIIDDPIASFAVDPPRSFTLVFESGHSLVIFDDDEHYESFQIYFEGGSSFIA